MNISHGSHICIWSNKVKEIVLDNKTILSGIQPSGSLCIGNYLGALKNWNSLQHDYNSIFLVVDLHALTIKQIPSELRKRCLSFTAQYLACGIDPKISKIVIQSHVTAHIELMWILSTICYTGEIKRMTQFKDKASKSKNINVGLLTYPILMASDILLYQADLVPVGADQKQHLELARNLAKRFNFQYSDTFNIPEPYIAKSGSRIMSLQDVDKKMSKSDNNVNNLISLLDPPKLIIKKINSAVTDSEKEISYCKKTKPGISNLIDIYALLTKKSINYIVDDYQGKLYSEFKNDLSNLIIDELKPIQDNYNKLINDKTYLNDILKESSKHATYIARKTLSKVYRKVGLIQR